MSVFYGIQAYLLNDEGEWVTCSESGLPISSAEPMNPGHFGRDFARGRILSDGPIRYALAKGFRSVEGSPLSLVLNNLDGSFGSIDGRPPFDMFVCNKDKYLLMLSVCVDRAEIRHSSPEFVESGPGVCVWRGFLENTKYLKGGDEVSFEFGDLTYWAGQFQTSQNYALIDREELFNALADKLPFVVGDEADPDDHGVDMDVEEPPPCWDMRLLNTLQSITKTSDPVEIARKDETTLWLRQGSVVWEIDVETGETIPGTALSSANFEPPDSYNRGRFIHDPNVLFGVDYGLSSPVPFYKDGTEEVPDQTTPFNNVVYTWKMSADGSEIYIYFSNWDDTTFSWSALMATTFGPKDTYGQSNWSIVLGRTVGGTHIRVLTPESNMKGYYYSSPDEGEFLYTRTGQILHYVRGHKIEGDEYPFLGYRRETKTWIWTRINDDFSLETKQAFIVGEASDRAASVSKHSLYYLNTARYPNCLCYVDREDDIDVLVIVNDKFELLEKLYPGERPVSASGDNTAESIASMTLTGEDDLPTMIGYCPQGHEGFIDDALHIARLNKDRPETLSRGKWEDVSVGKALSEAVKPWGAWSWIKPNMRLAINNPGATPPRTTFDLWPEVSDNDGDEDSVGYWEEQYERIVCKYGAGREVSIGTKKWNYKDGSLDLENVVFSQDHAEKLALQEFLIYNPFRLAVDAPLYRGILLGLWQAMILHREWVSTETELNQYSLTGFVKGIEKPITLGEVWTEIEFWIVVFFYDVQWGWYYLGMDNPDAPCPASGAPWCGTVFLGDELGYTPDISEMLRDLFDSILDALNDPVWEGDFETWWEMNYLTYWSEIYAIIEALHEIGYFEEEED